MSAPDKLTREQLEGLKASAPERRHWYNGGLITRPTEADHVEDCDGCHINRLLATVDALQADLDAANQRIAAFSIWPSTPSGASS